LLNDVLAARLILSFLSDAFPGVAAAAVAAFLVLIKSGAAVPPLHFTVGKFPITCRR
jgi:hypothetical protein